MSEGVIKFQSYKVTLHNCINYKHTTFSKKIHMILKNFQVKYEIRRICIFIYTRIWITAYCDTNVFTTLYYSYYHRISEMPTL